MLLGDLQSALEFLQAAAITEHSNRAHAFQLALQAMEISAAHAFL